VIDLATIERRIGSLHAIRDILSALRALSSVQYRRAEEGLEARRAYEAALFEAMAAVPASLAPARPPGRVLLLVLGAEQGFCGALVDRVVDAATARLRPPAYDVTRQPFALGARTRDLLEDRLGAQVPGLPLPGSLSSLDPVVDAIASAVERRVEARTVDGVEALYARHLGPGRSEISAARILPAEISPPAGRPARLQEPAGRVLDRILFEWAYGELHRLVLEAQASEHGARMTTTDGATRAIDDTLAELRVTHHQARQAQVTAEVQEIVAAAEVMLEAEPDV
jgi:F-type H+-transporting ATPase subunit gamma